VEHLRARFAGQPHVEDDNIVLFGDCAGFPIIAIGDKVYSPSLFLKPPFDELSNGGVVFDYEDFHRAGWPLSVNAKKKAELRFRRSA
jgi:hypothetical protein